MCRITMKAVVEVAERLSVESVADIMIDCSGGGPLMLSFQMCLLWKR